MSYNKRSTRTALLASTTMLLATSISGATIAQDAAVEEETAVETITVTGSRIVRKDLVSASPVATIGAEEFKLTGAQNVEQVLATLPQTIPGFGGSSNNPGNGTATVNLRGLGTSRTLVLVNGRRYLQSGQSGVVDLNTIPSALIERVEVVTGGASAVYGSDALAGVVNFIIKDDFEGMEITSQYDTTFKGDAEKYNMNATFGGNFADGKGNATVHIGYMKRKALFQGERNLATYALGDDASNTSAVDEFGRGGGLSASGSSGVPGTRIFAGDVITADGTVCGIFNSDGSCSPWVNSGPNTTRFNYAPDNYLQLPQTRWMITSSAHYDVSDKIRLYAETTFVNNQVDQELAPTPAFTTVNVNPDSPFFSADVQDAWRAVRGDTNGDGFLDAADDGNVPVFIGRRMVENGSRQALNTRNGFRMVTGAKGEIDDNWTYDVFYSYAHVDYAELLNNDVSASKFIQAIAVTDDGTACQDPSNGCSPINIWGPGNIDQAAIDFVNIGASNNTSITSQNAQALVSGSLGDLTGAGDVGLAVGVEWRSDSSSYRPDEYLASGDVLGFNAGEATVGDFSVKEIFSEMVIPLVEGVELSAAGRYSDYSNVGGVWSYAGGMTWAPIDDIKFRAQYQRAVRAPNVSELFSGNANGFPGADDPCAIQLDGTTPDPSIQGLCEATGVPAGAFGVFTQSNGQIEGIFGGNPDLYQETSDTYTFGAVFTPTMISGFTATIDYYKITINDSISVLGGGVNSVLNICYNEIQDAASPFCQAITRRSDGNVDTVKVLNANIAKLGTEGIDLQMNYSTDVDWGFFDGGSSLHFSFIGTHVMENYFIGTNEGDLATSTFVECSGTYGGSCGEPDPKYRFNLRSTLDNGPLQLSVNWRWIGKTEGEGHPFTLKSANYFDLSSTYNISEKFEVYAGIRNLFDKKPQLVGDEQEQANTFPETYDAIGTRLFMGVKINF